jgi:hypothetical protein
LSPKQFLADELSNIKEALDDALRFDYGGGSRGFYVECLERHKAIGSQLDDTPSNDAIGLYDLSGEIFYLAELVHRIERSHEAEFSWQFYHHIKEVASSIFEDTSHSHDLNKIPIIHVYAEGGLGYQIHVEKVDQHIGVDNPILTVVFPRTLKRHVLLHAIFAHEIGHAVRLRSFLDNQLQDAIIRPLLASGPLKREADLRAWVRKHHQDDWTTDADTCDAWAEEIACDIFGALCFGPSFCFALESLLLAVDPTKLEPGIEHPPGAARIALMSRLWRTCGWNDPRLYCEKTYPKAAMKMAEGIKASRKYVSWSEELVSDSQLRTAVTGIRKMLKSTKLGLYKRTDVAVLERMVGRLLRGIPPSGARAIFEDGSAPNDSVDFRSILLAGWYVQQCREKFEWKRGSASFLELSKSCEMGMLHQHAIEIVKT